ncbi:hypothetical protein [Sutcliffiella halmapala]|uniref:hypothetical protein n=1 Tax=Sutcliffiella halmapala TaxID=79882 RepID=UPI000994D4D1|nr:hypothetical protein [Sutcliffiella halmapala]
MNSYDIDKVASVLAYFDGELKRLIGLLAQYENEDYGKKATIQQQIKQQFKNVKDELKKQIKVLIEFNSNNLVVDYLLPPLCVAYIHLQDIGINRINPNSIHKVSDLTLKANAYISKYYKQLVTE